MPRYMLRLTPSFIKTVTWYKIGHKIHVAARLLKKKGDYLRIT